MARLLGVEIPNEKRIVASLPYIYGINHTSSAKILDSADINKDIKTKDLSAEQINQIVQAISALGIIIEGDLRREQQSNMKRLMSINCYRAIRHRMGLPVRGQRTSTNARTRKGKRRTVGIQRRAGAKKGKV